MTYLLEQAFKEAQNLSSELQNDMLKKWLN
jgi:hypothetical protein